MTLRLLVVGLVIVCAACSKTVVGTETGNPPVLTTSIIIVEAIGETRVRVSGESGAITPGGGEVSITNTSRGDEPAVADVAEDGSFSVELEGDPDDDYELAASNAAGRSPTRTVSGSGPTSGDWQTWHMCADTDPMDPLIVTELRIRGTRSTLACLMLVAARSTATAGATGRTGRRAFRFRPASRCCTTTAATRARPSATSS